MVDWVERPILKEILEAIFAEDGSTVVFYITGEGGQGKTVLLRQVEEELSRAEGRMANFRWSGILDLYYSQVNSNSGLEAMLSQALETANEFQPYRDVREDYTERRYAGLTGEELEEERRVMAEVFARCMNDVTARHRVVVALDTTERIQYELDQVQQRCDLESGGTTVRPWLLHQLLRWQNCVVVLVGRPEEEPYLERALDETQGADVSISYKPRRIRGFDEAEAEAYFEMQERRFPDLCHLDRQVRQQLLTVTKGRPILLDLALEVVRHQLGFDQLWQEISTLNQDEACEKIKRLLISYIMNREPDPAARRVLRFLAVARKGLNAELLHRMVEDWDEDECKQKLDEVADRFFIRRRPENDRLFLHDEMYELCDRYLLKGDEAQRLSRSLVEWYDRRIEALQSSKRMHEALRDHQVDSLFYRLRADPRQGYEDFARWADEAIRRMEVGFDMRMRTEILAFVRSQSPIDQDLLRQDPGLRKEQISDCAARWAKRYIMWGQRDKAVHVGREMLQTDYDLPPDGDPGVQLAHADLAVLYAEASIYLGSWTDGIRALEAVISEQEGQHKPEELAQVSPDTFGGWRRNLVLGRAHTNLGYALRTYEGHYRLALEQFRQALPYFRASGLHDEMVNTMDNMGRVYALLHQRSRAEALVEDGLELSHDLGSDYRTALSENSRALVHILFGEPHRAQAVAKHAHGRFENLESKRGLGLACITLGRALRLKGALWAAHVYLPTECDEFLREGMERLQTAINIFTKDIKEPAHRIEACNELGCLFRERAALARDGDSESPAARRYARDAIAHLTKSIELAEQNKAEVAYVDSCEDLSQTYFQRRDWDNAELWLRKAEVRIPDLYKIEKTIGLRTITPQACVEEFWQLLGKVELLRGHLYYERGKMDGTVSRQVLEEATRHYAFAAAYFERYSERAARLVSTLKQLYGRFKVCDIDDLVHIQKHVLPGISEQYKLDLSTAGRFFGDTLGLMVEFRR